jgi:hypothetical protein
MGKRFTETNKWSDKWYRGLPPDFKLAWTYITDCCDQAGVIDIDRELANFQIGTAIDWDAFAEACEDRVIVTRRGKWFITGFIKFQYGRLSPDCKPHMPVIQLLEKHGIDAESVEQNQNFKYGNITPNRREKVFARDGHICCYCGEQFPPDGLEPDHVIPVSRGGNDAMGNLVAACVQCNRAKWDHHPTAFINALPDSDAVWQRLSQRVNERLYRSLKDKEQEKEKDQDKETVKEKETSGTKRFVPPTVEEVAAHCRARNNTIDAEAFVAHYTANGWVQGNGKKPVRDWKACIITWEKNSQSNRGSPVHADDPRGNFTAAQQYLESLKK